MANKLSIHHWVALAGRVIDQQSKQPLVEAELSLIAGPPAFQRIVAVRQQDPQWLHRKERINHTVSRAGGLFYFMDLPAGDDYQLAVTVPRQLARYAMYTHAQPLTVAPQPDAAANHRAYPWVEIALPSTGVVGRVTTMINGGATPVVRARVTIQDAQTTTDANGDFALHGLIGAHKEERPKARLEVKAAGFAPQSVEVALQAGAVPPVPLAINLIAL